MDWTNAINEDGLGNPSGFWEYTGKEVSFTPMEGKKDKYTVDVKLNYSYKTTGKGAAQGQKDIQLSQKINTGVSVSKTNEYTYSSDDIK